MVEMKVIGLAVDEKTQIPILLMTDTAEKYILPIWIGATESMSISLVLDRIKLHRPMTHDLFLNTIQALEGNLIQVEVVEIKDNTYYATLVVTQGENKVRIDARPSDAIALALRQKCPILVDDAMLKHIPNIKTRPISVTEEKQWQDILQTLKESDNKYKM